MSRSRIWLTLALCLALGSCGVLLGSYALAQTRVNDARPSAEAKMKAMTAIDAPAMIAVKLDLMSDERLAYMVAHETMVQTLLRDKSFMASIATDLRKHRETIERKLQEEQFSTMLTKMMADKQANRRAMKDLLVRQIAAAQTAAIDAP